MREKKVLFGISIIVITMVTVPYISAFQAADSSHVFGGFLLNPIDGHSYLAKMQLGYQGDWKFTLPYTAEKGEGAYLFLFYIVLGHIARILKAKLLIVFHLTRILGAILLLWSMSEFNRYLFSERWQRSSWFMISSLGAGFGWIAVLLGLFTSDFWVAEAYPFLSMYANPHFTIGLGLMLFSLIPGKRKSPEKSFALGVVLGIIQPFSVVIVVLVKAAQTINEVVTLSGTLRSRINSSELIQNMIAFGLGGGIILGYQYIAIQRDPYLALWNVQNITPAPLPLDLFLSLSPCLILAVFGISYAWQREKGKLLIYWAMISLCLIFIPWNLQRRFLTGIYLPISGLAIFGLDHLIRITRTNKNIAAALLFILVIPTNFIVMLSGQQASTKKDPAIYWDADLNEAFNWINAHTQVDSIFLTDENIGLYIPSQTGRRVLYGHPFETVEAESQIEFIQNFFERKYPIIGIQEELLIRGVDYVIVSVALEQINQDMIKSGFPSVYHNSDVVIYEVE